MKELNLSVKGVSPSGELLLGAEDVQREIQLIIDGNEAECASYKQSLADRTAELEQVKRVANELSAQIAEVNENRTGVSPCARFCEALAAKKMFDNLQRERDELAAQVEQLNQRNNELEVMQPSYNLLRNAFYDGACWNESTINNGALSLDKNAHEYANEKLAELTPAQCLAKHDREVAAMAVESAIRSALRTFGNADLSEDEIKKLASEYSGKVLRGEI